MRKPCRNNSSSYEDCLVIGIKRAVLSGGEFNERESLLEDLQRKERECPFLQVLKIFQRSSLNKGVSSTANRAFLFLASEEEGNLGRDNLSRPISSPLCDCNARLLQREPLCPQCTHIRTESLPSSHQEYRGQNFRIWKQGLLHC